MVNGPVLRIVPVGPVPEGFRPARGLYKWSPMGHLLASWGGPCGGGLEIRDGASGQLLTLPPEVTASAVAVAWRPDGKALAVAVKGDDAGVLLVDTENSGPSARLFSMGVVPTVGLPIPRSFSASGDFLLLIKQGGFDCSN